ncbi:MAG: hypothetical protein Q9160_002522 [Pyrenula sp. 1 TL-2023]
MDDEVEDWSPSGDSPGVYASVTGNNETGEGHNVVESLPENGEYFSRATSGLKSERKPESETEIQAREAAPPKKHNNSDIRAREARADQLPAFQPNADNMPSRYPPTSYPSTLHSRANSVDNAANIVVPIRVGIPNKLNPSRQSGRNTSPTPVVPVRAKSVDPPSELSNAAPPIDFRKMPTGHEESGNLEDKYHNDDQSPIKGQGQRSETSDSVPRFPSTKGSFDVETLMSNYHTELAKLDAKDAETMEEMENLLDMFKAWQTAGKQKEEDRAEKRLRTQSKLVQAEEARLKKKRETHAKAMETLQAFMEIVKDS